MSDSEYDICQEDVMMNNSLGKINERTVIIICMKGNSALIF